MSTHAYEYQRVIPRDLFNESKLLKCLGRLSLLAHHECLPGLRIEHDGSAFDIQQCPYDGGLYCANLKVYAYNRKLRVASCYNSKSPYPLVLHADDVVEVFDDAGEFTEEFKERVAGCADKPLLSEQC